MLKCNALILKRLKLEVAANVINYIVCFVIGQISRTTVWAFHIPKLSVFTESFMAAIATL